MVLLLLLCLLLLVVVGVSVAKVDLGVVVVEVVVQRHFAERRRPMDIFIMQISTVDSAKRISSTPR